MELKRPFKVLVVDDSIGRALRDVRSQEEVGASSELGAVGEWLKPVLQISDSYPSDSPKIELFVMKDLKFKEGSTVLPGGGSISKDDLPDFDVIVLDFGEVKITRTDRVTLADLGNGATETEVENLNHDFGGAAFYLHNRQLVESAQVVIFLTKYDNEDGDASAIPDVIRRYIHPFTRTTTTVGDKRPIMCSKLSAGTRRLLAEIENAYKRFARKFTQLENNDAIRFAASHDEPIIVVGETGTGKEDIAIAIHHQWRNVQLRKQQANPPERTGADLISEEPTIVNCAGLSDNNLARDELFGHVAGAFSDAQNHHLGEILAAYGAIEFTTNPRSANHLADYRARLTRWEDESRTHNNSERFEQVRGTIQGRFKFPMGTIFLDEFGDLPPSAQTGLLRYLQEYEVTPMGYAGRIKNIHLRVIVATSDPRVAAFLGEELRGSYRSRGELQRPLRADLLFRLKGQIIRSAPVTLINLERTVNHFIKHSSHPGFWENDKATPHLITRLSEAIALSEEPPPTGRRTIFGHRREISRIVRLCNLYVDSAAERGERYSTKEVTPDIIDKLWKHSWVVTEEIEDFEEADQILAEHVNEVLNKVVQYFDGIRVPLPEGWLEFAPRKRREVVTKLVTSLVESGKRSEVENLHHLLVKKKGDKTGLTEELWKAAFGSNALRKHLRDGLSKVSSSSS